MTAAPTVLIVEQDPTIRLMTATGLRNRGYTTQLADDVDSALARMVEDTPDITLSSVSLPGRGGYELIRSVRAGAAGPVNQESPLLVLTALDDTESIHEAFTAGATDFITKPVNLALLAERVKFSLAAARRARELRDVQLEQASACRLARLGFWRLDIPTGRLEWSSDAAEILDCEMLPTSLDALIARAPVQDGYRLTAAFEAATTSEQGVDIELALQLSDDRTSMLRLQSSARTETGTLVGAFQDVTALREFEDRARYLTEYDELTDLPKRRLFRSLFNERLQADPAQPWSITVIDVSGMHRANALLGIAAGDAIVAGFSQRLRQAIDEPAVVARLEADSFVVAAPVNDREAMQAAHERWLAPLAHAHTVNDQEVFIDFSAGVSLYPNDETDADALIRNAQLAQQFGHARHSRHRVMLYSDTETLGGSEVLTLERDIRLALERGQFFLAYQFQERLGSGRFTGAEALLRWRHPVDGIISPGRFIPMLEENGLIAEVGEWVIDEACRQLAAWQAMGIDLSMGVNISAQQFEQSDLAERITAITREHGVAPGSLKLEITESMAMQNPEATLQTLTALRSAGFRLALDDFGTGYSSYEYLLRFPMDTLKIDRTFVTDVAENRSNRSVIRSLTSLAAGLGLQTIAEGVETQRQRDYLDALDIDEIQGFLINRPMPPEECLDQLL